LSTHNLIECKKIAQSIRSKRENNVDGFKGVRALAFPLPSQSLIQISFNLTNPDESSFDALYEVVRSFDLPIHSTELIGVIRSEDLPNSYHLKIHPDQIVI
jgi:glutamate formiminotransferase